MCTKHVKSVYTISLQSAILPYLSRYGLVADIYFIHDFHTYSLVKLINKGEESLTNANSVLNMLSKAAKPFRDLFCLLVTIVQVLLPLFFVVYNSIYQDVGVMVRMAEVLCLSEVLSIFIIVLLNRNNQ